MQKTLLNLLNEKTGISTTQIEKTLKLFEQGATIPFISR